MYSRILVGFENTEQGRDALELARVIARATGAAMLVASITTRGDGGRLGPTPGAERLAAFTSAHLHEPDIPIEGRQVKASSAAIGLARLAESEEADLIVVGSTHRGPLGRILPGGTAERLLGTAPCGVAVAPRGLGWGHGASEWRPLSEPGEDAGLRVIGVGYDGSAEADDALATATDLALHNGAALRIFAVGGVSAPGASGFSPQEQHGASLREALESAVASLPSQARAEAVYLSGHAASALAEASEQGVDLLILGSRGAGPLRQALLGTVSSKVMHGAGCPVLISPSAAASRHAALALV